MVLTSVLEAPGHLKVFQASATRWRPMGPSRTCWGDYGGIFLYKNWLGMPKNSQEITETEICGEPEKSLNIPLLC